jgi:hypothetical protein
MIEEEAAVVGRVGFLACNRTEMFHVQHFGKIETGGNEPRFVGLRGLFPSHTSLNLALFAEKGGERGAGFIRLHGGGK